MNKTQLTKLDKFLQERGLSFENFMHQFHTMEALIDIYQDSEREYNAEIAANINSGAHRIMAERDDVLQHTRVIDDVARYSHGELIQMAIIKLTKGKDKNLIEAGQLIAAEYDRRVKVRQG